MALRDRCAVALLAWGAACQTDGLSFERGAGASCDSDSACVEGLYCEPMERRCTPQKDNAADCTLAGECRSGRCVHGVCCDGPCNAACLACDLPDSRGVCSVVPSGADPHEDCPGTAACGSFVDAQGQDQDLGRCQGSLVWGSQLGAQELDAAIDVAVDGERNVIVLGSSAGMFLAKLDPDGHALWSASVPGAVTPAALAVDSEGNILVVGEHTGTLVLGGAPMVADGIDAFVAKLDPDGELIWQDPIGGARIQRATDVAVDAEDGVIVIGEYDEEISLEPLPPGNGYDVFVVSYPAAGPPAAWHTIYGDGNEQHAGVITVDGARNILAAFHGQGTIDYGSGMLPGALTDDDLFLLKLEPSAGAAIWGLLLFGDGAQIPTDIAASVRGDAWLVGTFDDALDVSGTVSQTQGGLDGFVAKVAGNGAIERSLVLQGAFDDVPGAVALDQDDNAIVGGRFGLGLDIVGGTETDSLTLTGVGSSDIFLLKLDALGSSLWAQPFGGLLAEDLRALSTDVGGEVIAAGGFEHVLTLSTQSLVAAGDQDIFVAKFAR